MLLRIARGWSVIASHSGVAPQSHHIRITFTWPSPHQSWCHYNVIAAVAVVLTTANVAVSPSGDSAVVAPVLGFRRCCCWMAKLNLLLLSLGICVVAKNAKKLLLENGKNITRHKQGFTYQCPLTMPSKKRKEVRIFLTRTNKQKRHEMIIRTSESESVLNSTP
jgi:hypothetical protein